MCQLRQRKLGRVEPEAAYLAPRWLRRAGSVAVALLGLAWFFDRVLFEGSLFEGVPLLGLAPFVP